MAACALLALPAASDAALPHAKSTKIVPGVSIGGIKLDMSRAQAFAKWGAGRKCQSGDVCVWAGKGKAGQREQATLSFYKGKVVQISLNAAFVGNNATFKAGPLAKWTTSKGISLASRKSAVHKAYPSAAANKSEGVTGYDLFAGGGLNQRLTRFAGQNVGASSGKRLRYISLSWANTCHYFACRVQR
jgi:hypothetical protein